MTSSLSSSSKGVGLAIVVPLVAAIVFSYVRLVADIWHVPDGADYAAARKVLDDNGFDRARDALVILPPWSLRPLTTLGDLDPISGDDIAHKPLHRYARLWAVVEPDAEKQHAPLVERRGLPSFSQAVGDGRVVVERFDLVGPTEPVPALYDLAAHLGDASVQIVDDGGNVVVACDQPAGSVKAGVLCPGRDAWQRVTRQWLLVTENSDLAVWSHPPEHGKRLEITWRDVPIGSAVVVEAGFTREGADAAKAPVRLTVLVDGEKAGVVVRRPPTFEFGTDVVDTKRFAGKNGVITFAVDSDDNASAHFAWDAVVVR